MLAFVWSSSCHVCHTHGAVRPHDARRRVSATSAPTIITLSTHEHTISQPVSVCGLWLGMRTHAHMTHACALSHAHARFCAWLILIPFARFCLFIFLPCMSHIRGRFHMMRVVVSRPHRRRTSRSRHKHTILQTVVSVSGLHGMHACAHTYAMQCALSHARAALCV